MNTPSRSVRMIRLLAVAAFGLTLGGFSLYFAYGVLTSEPWFWSFSGFTRGGEEAVANIGGQREFLRLLLTSVLFVIIHASILRRHSGFHSPSRSPIVWLFGNSSGEMSRKTTIMVVIAAIALLLYHLGYAPFRMHSTFVGQAGFLENQWFNDEFSIRAYVVPYLVYLPYSVVQFLVIALSSLVVLLRSARRDREIYDSVLRTKSNLSDPAGQCEAKLDARVVDTGRRAREAFEELQKLLIPYVSMFVYVGIVLYVELYTGLIDTLACVPQVLTRFSAWLFIGLGLFYFIKRLWRRNLEIVALFKKELTLCYEEAIKNNWGNVAKRVEKTRNEFQKRTQIAGQLRPFLDIRTSSLFVLPLVFTIFFRLMGTEIQKTGNGSSPLKEGINRLAPPGVDFLVLEIFSITEPFTNESQNKPYKCKLCFKQKKPPLAEVARWSLDANITTVRK